jgi:hypothetical protein
MAVAGESAATFFFDIKLQQTRFRYSSIEDTLPRVALWWRSRRIPDTFFRIPEEPFAEVKRSPIAMPYEIWQDSYG